MKILLLHAHPVETSFNAALHRIALEHLTAATIATSMRKGSTRA